MMCNGNPHVLHNLNLKKFNKKIKCKPYPMPNINEM